jgi:hypothetical protein
MENEASEVNLPREEFLQRMLEIYTLEELLEINELEPWEALELLVNYGAVSFDNIPV